MEKYNPYYNNEFFELEMIEFEDTSLYYEYDKLLFFATKSGDLFTAGDSGCSCPTPFEEYESSTTHELLKKLERVGSINQALQILGSWSLGAKIDLINSNKNLTKWIKKHAKNLKK